MPALRGVCATADPATFGVRFIASSRIFSALSRSILSQGETRSILRRRDSLLALPSHLRLQLRFLAEIPIRFGVSKSIEISLSKTEEDASKLGWRCVRSDGSATGKDIPSQYGSTEVTHIMYSLKLSADSLPAQHDQRTLGCQDHYMGISASFQAAQACQAHARGRLRNRACLATTLAGGIGHANALTA